MRYLLTLLFGAFALCGCTPADDPVDDAGSSTPTLAVTLEAQPWTIPADGSSRMVLFVECRLNGEAIDDSTEVIFLNTIGRLSSGIVLTRAGVALDTLTADTSAALGFVIAYCQGVRDSVEVMFTEQ